MHRWLRVGWVATAAVMAVSGSLVWWVWWMGVWGMLIGLVVCSDDVAAGGYPFEAFGVFGVPHVVEEVGDHAGERGDDGAGDPRGELEAGPECLVDVVVVGGGE